MNSNVGTQRTDKSLFAAQSKSRWQMPYLEHVEECGGSNRAVVWQCCCGKGANRTEAEYSLSIQSDMLLGLLYGHLASFTSARIR